MKDLTKSSLNRKIKKGFSVIEFYADWCSPCKEVKGHLNKLKKKYPSVKIGRVNVDSQPKIASTYSVVSIPCFLMFKEGEEIERLVDIVPYEVLRNEVDARRKS